jgi:succinoglycan biosynthesis protein ExoM
MKIIIAVCTYKRHASLVRCVESIQKMIIPPNISVEIAVIDNEPSPIIADICQQKNVTYSAEPMRGLVFARNRVLQFARSKNADYLGVIDDDETVSENWLNDMLTAFDTTNADAIAGIIDIKLGDNMPSYLKTAYQFKKVTAIKSVKTLPMGNVMLGKKIIQADMWFDKKFNFTGGEDVNFFNHISKAGFKLYKIPNAQVTEYLMPEKASLRAYFNRQMRVAKLHYAEKYPSFSLQFFGECVVSMFEIVLVTVLSPLCILSDRFKVKSTKTCAKAIGRLLSRQTKTINAYGI